MDEGTERGCLRIGFFIYFTMDIAKPESEMENLLPFEIWSILSVQRRVTE